MNQPKGITLIALVITIIILLILAGITIATLTGENGILNKASIAKEESLIKNYQEQLDLIWQGVKIENIDKNKTYEEILEQVKQEIEKDTNFEGAKVEIIDGIIEVITKEGYIFHILEGKTEYVGKEGEEKGIITTTLIANEAQNKKITFTATAVGASWRRLTYVFYINGEEKQRETTYKTTFTTEEQVTSFGEVITAYVEIEYGEQEPSISNEIIVEDNTIASKEELEKFRDNVNEKHITYENKKVELISDIDLQGSQTKQWVPIGNENDNFKGTFDGNYHTISNLVINVENKNYQGLFGYIEKADIQNVKLNDVNINSTTGNYIGGIAGTIYEGIISRCGVDGEIKGNEAIGRYCRVY